MAVFGIHTMAVTPDWNPAEAGTYLPKLRDLGVGLIEIPLLRPDRVDAAASRTILEAHDMRVTCSLGLPRHFDIVTRPEEALSFLTMALKVSADIGAEVLSGVTYGTIGKTSGAAATQTEKDAVASLIEQAAREAKRLGLRLGVEPCNRYETHLMNTAADGTSLLRRAGAENTFVHLDTYHMNIEEAGMGLGVETAGSDLGYIHLSESNRGVPGLGSVDWDGTLQALAGIGYDGPLVLESFNYLHPDIAAGLAIWRPVADNPDDVIEVGIPFLIEKARAAGLSL